MAHQATQAPHAVTTREAEDIWASRPVFGTPPARGVPVARPSAYAIVIDGRGRIAVVQTSKGTFLPGGGIEAGESPRDAIEREALEECGLTLSFGSWTAHAVQFVHSEPESTHFEKRCTFLDATLETLGGGSEADHVLLWMAAEEASDRLTPESHGWAVASWLSSHLHHQGQDPRYAI